MSSNVIYDHIFSKLRKLAADDTDPFRRYLCFPPLWQPLFPILPAFFLINTVTMFARVKQHINDMDGTIQTYDVTNMSNPFIHANLRIDHRRLVVSW